MPDSILLYRYFSAANAIRTIEMKAFRVGRVVEFNDPFECKIGFKNHDPQIDATLRTVQAKLLDKLNSQFGVICFSDTAEDSVLWSHYADRHRGIALEVDHLLHQHLHKVSYDAVRPLFDLQQINSPDSVSAFLGIFKQALSHKSPGWSYEREYRVFADLANCTVADGSYFLPIPPDFLKRVILGSRCIIDENYIRRSLDLAGFKEVGVVRAYDDHHTYKIKC